MFTMFRILLGYFAAYFSYRFTYCAMREIFEEADRIVNNNKLPPDDNIKFPDSTITTHDYELGEKVVETICRGGEDVVAVAKQTGLIQRMAEQAGKPLGKFIGFLMLNVPPIKKLIDTLTNIGNLIFISLATIAGLVSLRAVAPWPFWAVIISGGLPNCIRYKYLFSALRRVQLGANPQLNICITDTTDIVGLFQDNTVSEYVKNQKLFDLLQYYENLPESSILKNTYFVCVVEIFTRLFFGKNHTAFTIAIRLLWKLLNQGVISLETYREIINYLLGMGVPFIDMIIE